MRVSSDVIRGVEELIVGHAEKRIERSVLDRIQTEQKPDAKLVAEVNSLRATVDKMEKALAPPKPFFPLEMKQDLKRIIERGFSKKKSIPEIKQAIRHYFKREREGR